MRLESVDEITSVQSLSPDTLQTRPLETKERQQTTSISKTSRSTMRKLKADTSYQANIQALYETQTAVDHKMELEKLKEKLAEVNIILTEEELAKALPLYIQLLKEIMDGKYIVEESLLSDREKGQFLSYLAFAYLSQGDEENAKANFIKALERENSTAAVFIYFHPEMFPSDTLTEKQKADIRMGLASLDLNDWYMDYTDPDIEGILLYAMVAEYRGEKEKAAEYIAFASDLLIYNMKVEEQVTKQFYQMFPWIMEIAIAGMPQSEQEVFLFICEQMFTNFSQLMMVLEPQYLAETMNLRIFENNLPKAKPEDLRYPVDFEHAHYLVDVNYQLGNYEECIKWATLLIEAKDRLPENRSFDISEIQETRGLSYLKINKVEEAVFDLKNTEYDFLRALAHLVLKEDGISDLKKAVQYSDSNKIVAALLLHYMGEDIQLVVTDNMSYNEQLRCEAAKVAMNGDLEKALTVYNDLITDDYPYWAISTQMAARKERAIVYLMMGEKELAAADLAEVKQMESFIYFDYKEDEAPVAQILAYVLDINLPA